jgi:hypothetical protein
MSETSGSLPVRLSSQSDLDTAWNCSTTVIERMLRDHHADINAFLANPVAAFLALA